MSSLASRRSFFDAVEQRVQNAEANLHAVDGHAGGNQTPAREGIH
jgi:hypothetical protein